MINEDVKEIAEAVATTCDELYHIIGWMYNEFAIDKDLAIKDQKSLAEHRDTMESLVLRIEGDTD